MDDNETVDTQGKTCAVCNKETMLALFGVALGLLFIAMSLDTLRRIRKESTVEGETVD